MVVEMNWEVRMPFADIKTNFTLQEYDFNLFKPDFLNQIKIWALFY